MIAGVVGRRVVLVVVAALAATLGLVVVEPSVAQAAPAAKPAQSGPLVAADVRSAQLTARVRHARVEALSERTEISSTFVNPDGSFTSETTGLPSRVRDRNGKDGWSDVDLTLVARPDGSVGPRVHPMGLTMAGKTGSAGGLLASLTDRGGRAVQLGWNGALPAPSLDGPTATYAGVSPGVDLVQEATRMGVEQFLTLKDRAAADAAVASASSTGGVYEVRIPVKTKGLSAQAGKHGGVDFVDARGKVVQSVAAPRMWDAAINPGSGLPANEHPVSMRFEATASKGQGELVLGADPAWLSDPSRTFPITIDPTTTYGVYSDTWVENDYTTAQAGSTELRVGSWDGGAHIARTFFTWDSTTFKGASVSYAELQVHNYYSYSCSARAMNIRSAEPNTVSTVWSTQPGVGSVWYSPSFAHGYSSSCVGAWEQIPITSLAQAWAGNGVNLQGMALFAASETDSYGWKRFESANNGTNVPKIVVTYNRYPDTPGVATHTPGTSSNNTSAHGWSTSTTPTLKATVSDPDGGTVKGLFSVYRDGTTLVVDKQPGSTVTSGGVSQDTVPAGVLVDGGTYTVRVYGNDGSLTSANWSDYDNFVVDATVPAIPTVTSSTSPENQWSAQTDSNGKLAFTATGSSSDTAKIQYSLDDTTYGTSVSATPNTAVGFTVAAPATGQHTLYVRTVDTAGNVSAGKAYVFYFGNGVALFTPTEGQVTARRVPLQLTVDPTLASSLGSPSFEYRRGAADTWKTIPLANVTNSSGATLTAWPTTADSTTVSYWDAAATLSGGGVVDVRAKFSANSSVTDPNTVTVDVNAGQAGSSPAGPGTVNLLTGELSLSASDAAMFGASIGRTYGSRSLTAGTDNGQSGAFGPQWALSGASAYTDANWQAVHQTSTTSLDVIDADGGTTSFTANGQGGWTPEPGSEDLTLTGAFTTSFTLTDTSGNTTTFAKPAANGATQPPADTWPVASTTPAVGSSGATAATARYGFTTDTAGKLHLSRIAAPNGALTDTQLQACANPTTDLSTTANRGCRVLDLIWGVPTGGYTGQRVTAINAWAWDPTTSAMTSTTEATYGYDSTGRLTSETNPKPGLVSGGHALTTNYGYDSSGLLTTLTPPGQLAWTFGYATAGVVAGPTWDRTLPTSTGRVVTVSRATLTPGSASLTNGTATTAIVYGVPTSATYGPAAMDATATQTWNQPIPPTDATAVFDVDGAAQPSGDYWAGDDTSKRSWAKAAVTYLDVNGREINHLGRDGLMDATTDDTAGNPIFELTGGNRALALGQGPDSAAKLAELGLTGLDTATRAQDLATVTAYETGTSGAERVTWTQGPLHTVVTAAGTETQQRATTRTSYDSGRPSDAATMDLATSTVTGGLTTSQDAATGTLDNPRTVTTAYDWTLGQAISTTTDPSPATGDEITTRTTYDAKGRVKTQQQPSDSAGTTAGTRVTTYWDDNTGTCTGHPEWGDLVCQTSHAAAITGSTSNTALPVTTTSYARTGAPSVVTETANGATRTTTTTFDAAARPSSVTVTATGLGTAPPAQTMSYDPATGAPLTVSGGGKSISTTLDQLGRQLTYTDGTGLRTASQYDTLGRVAKSTQSDTATGGLTRAFDTTMSYDATTGRTASQTDTQGGATALGYDTAGNLTTQTQSTAPGSLTVTSTFDPTGDEVTRSWTMTGQSTPVLTESVVSNIHGQQADHTMMPGGHRDYRYDNTGRLTSVTDLDAGACATRAYRFDGNSNRTGFTATSAAATADSAGNLTVCPAPTTPSASTTYDTGDRDTTTGTTYDAFGRTTRLPMPGGQVMRVAYQANDLVASQTLYATAADADANNGAGTNPVDASTYTLDVTGQRISTRTTGVSVAVTKTLRYAGSGDSPAWTDEGDGTITRAIAVPGGDLAATALITKAGTAANDQLTWQLADLHGDIAATLPADTATPLQMNRPDEYGASSAEQPRYSWLGAKQRAGDTPGGILLMGVRLYNPNTGRFLSMDPVYGGNATTYAYPSDPINAFDLDGRLCLFGKRRNGRCRGAEGVMSTVRNPWFQAGVTLAACSTGVACGAAVYGFTAFNIADRYNNQYHRHFTREFVAGALLDIALTRIPIRSIRTGAFGVGRHYAASTVRTLRGQALARNVLYSGVSIIRAHTLKW